MARKLIGNWRLAEVTGAIPKKISIITLREKGIEVVGGDGKKMVLFVRDKGGWVKTELLLFTLGFTEVKISETLYENPSFGLPSDEISQIISWANTQGEAHTFH